MAEAAQAPVGERATPLKPLPFEMSPLDEHTEWLKMLIHAIPGAGKTTLAGSAVDVEEMREVLFLNVEAGALSLKNNPRVKSSKLIQAIRITNFSQIDQIKDWLAAHCVFRDAGDVAKLCDLEERITGKRPKVPKRFKTLIVDSISELDNMSMQNILGLSDKISLEADIPAAEWSHYKQNNSKMQILLRRLRDLPMNVIMTSVTKWVQDETKKMHYSPGLTGQLRDQVQGFVDIVGFLAVGSPSDDNLAPRRLYVQPVNKSDGKNRWAGYDKAYFDDPTMSSILKAVGLID